MGRRSKLSLAALAILLLTGVPASAGFLDMMFGGPPEPYQRGSSPPRVNAYADPYAAAPDPSASAPAPAQGGTGRSLAYCVRLCDGRYFPMQRNANATSIQLCNAFCPASKTQVFNGSQIDYAVASNGARYGDLDNAFVYRQKVIPDCTCNGKDAFGLSKIDIANDPTLRPGDIVSTGDNVKVALTAMAASKERREAANDLPPLRGSAARKAAAKPGATVAAETPAAVESDERPED